MRPLFPTLPAGVLSAILLIGCGEGKSRENPVNPGLAGGISNDSTKGDQVRTDLAPLAPPDTSRPIYEERIAFTVLLDSGGGALYTVKPDGSDLTLLVGTVDAEEVALSWSPDRSRIVYSYQGDLYAIDVAGGEPVKLKQSTADDGYPSWSPDGQWIAFTSNREGSLDLYVMDSAGRNATNLTHLSDLPLSASRDLAGRAVWSSDSRQFAFSVYTNNDFTNAEIYVVNLEGQLRQLTQHPGSSFPAYSRRGDQIAFKSNADLYIMDVEVGNMAAVTKEEGFTLKIPPSWSPVEDRIAFGSTIPGKFRWNLYVAEVIGSRVVDITTYPLAANVDFLSLYIGWSPDGTRLLFREVRGATQDLYIMEIDGGGLVQLTNSGNVQSGLWSP